MHNCSTGNGYAARAVARKRVSSCGPPTARSSQSGWRPSLSEPAASCSQPAKRCANEAPRFARSSHPRKSRLPGSLGMACRTRRSARNSSSARARWSGISARYSPSSASALAGSCVPVWPRTADSSSAPSANAATEPPFREESHRSHHPYRDWPFSQPYAACRRLERSYSGFSGCFAYPQPISKSDVRHT